ncbi:Aminopeptidase N [Holothuria leucospilota]|uniref:Aminopeptidase n=1 Tax=Holothuria leucospilota TaxID=206669 RepID=A0A9Q1C0G8_HOLLE|nr:Aminopeptidase N [Holothuria leucospilota]
MADKHQFEVDSNSDDYSSNGNGKKKDGVYCSTGQLVFFGFVACCVIAGVGLMAYYLPDRTCTYEVLPSDNPIEASASPSPIFTEEGRTSVEPGSSTITPTPTAEAWNGRLDPDIMIPLSYDLTLQPCLYNECGDDMKFRFYGWVDIVIEVGQDTDEIKMHILDIEILKINVSVRVGEEADMFQSYTIDTFYEFLIIKTSSTLKKGSDYRVSIEYIGNLRDGLAGFYRSSYTNEAGETVWLATSQMQATDARRALPCWDEPGFRAVFDTKIIHMSNMTALSNGIELGTDPYDGDWQKTSYKTTPKMPTYLLAFVVSDFQYKEGYTTNGVRFRVWCRPDAINTTDYALQSGIDMLTYFEDYFSEKYPLEKQDMVAVPDFGAGAMENWGLIIYRETALLYNPEENSASNKQRVAVVVSHELAHQWFGNLVTPEWWDDLWLNEGFASYVEYLGVNFTEPTWKMMEQFLVEDLEYVFTLDALGTSHPVRVPVNSPAEISEIFDTISYAKGASIIRMLNNILTEDTFREGLTRYLSHYSEGNANSDKLWDALNQVQNKYDVKKIMDTWTLQMGYPVINITRNDKMLTATQSHFLIDPNSEVEDKYGDLGYLWYAQLTHTHETEQQYDNPSYDWLNATETLLVTFSLEDSVQADDWYLVNIKQYNYYRVNYDLENWERLAQQLQDDKNVIPNENRAALIDDAFNLARGGRLSYDTALSLTLYLENELEYIPWEATLTVFRYIRDMFSRNSGYGVLEKYMLCQIDSLYTSVGFEDDPDDAHLDQYNRMNAVGTACYYGNEDCLTKATTEFNEYMNDPENEKVSPNLRSDVYCYGIREGSAEEWEFGLTQYLESTDSAEKSKWLYALSCSREPWILSRYLSYSLDPSIVRQQDARSVISYISSNYVGRALAWDFFRSEYDAIFDYFGDSSFAFGDIVEAVTAQFNTEFDLEELVKFGEGREFGSATRAYEQSIDQTKLNIAWMEKNAETVAATLEQSLAQLGC